MRQMEIMYGNQSGSDAIAVRAPRRLYGFRADRLCIEIQLTLVNANVAAQDIAESFFRNAKLDWRMRDGSGFIVAASLASVEWAMQILQRRWAGALVQSNPAVQVAGSSTEVKTLFYDIPLAVPVASKPVDFAQSVAELGPLTFTPAATGNADVTIANVKIIVTAYGQQTDGMYAGARLRISNPANLAPQTQDAIPLGGKLLALAAWTKNGAVPIASTKPNVKAGQADLLTTSNIATLDVVKHLGSARWELFPRRPVDGVASGDFIDDIGHLIVPEEGFSLARLPGRPGEELAVNYDTNPAASSDHAYVLVEAVPRANCFKREVPGAAEMTPATFDGYVEPLPKGPGLVTPELLPYLPQIVRTPQVLQALGC